MWLTREATKRLGQAELPQLLVVHSADNTQRGREHTNDRRPLEDDGLHQDRHRGDAQLARTHQVLARREHLVRDAQTSRGEAALDRAQEAASDRARSELSCLGAA